MVIVFAKIINGLWIQIHKLTIKRYQQKTLKAWVKTDLKHL